MALTCHALGFVTWNSFTKRAEYFHPQKGFTESFKESWEKATIDEGLKTPRGRSITMAPAAICDIAMDDKTIESGNPSEYKGKGKSSGGKSDQCDKGKFSSGEGGNLSDTDTLHGNGKGTPSGKGDTTTETVDASSGKGGASIGAGDSPRGTGGNGGASRRRGGQGSTPQVASPDVEDRRSADKLLSRHVRTKAMVHTLLSTVSALLGQIQVSGDWAWARCSISEPMLARKQELEHLLQSRPFISNWSVLNTAELKGMYDTKEIISEISYIEGVHCAANNLEGERAVLMRMHSARPRNRR